MTILGFLVPISEVTVGSGAVHPADSTEKSSFLSGAFKFALLAAILLGACGLARQASAGVVISDSLQLDNLTITPASGSVTLSWDSAHDGALLINSAHQPIYRGPCPAALIWVSADCSVNPQSGTGAISVNAGVPTGRFGFAQGHVFLAGYLSITGTTGMVPVDVQATLPYTESAVTGVGSWGYSYDAFTFLTLNYGSPNFSAFRGHFLRPDSSVFDSGVWNVEQSLDLMAGRTYLVEVEIYSTAQANPEPSAVWLLLGGLALISFSRLRAGAWRHGRL